MVKSVFMLNDRGKVVGPHLKRKKKEVVETNDEKSFAAPEKNSSCDEVVDVQKKDVSKKEDQHVDNTKPMDVFLLSDEAVDTMRAAIEVFGVDAQLDMAVEEAAELIDVICKAKRGRVPLKNVMEELADVYIMLVQLYVVYAEFVGDGEAYNEVKKQIDTKISRLKGLITNHIAKAAGG